MANSPARAALDVGSVIADTYIIEALVGRGGMGSVFLASHKRLPGKQVAIKLLHAELIEDEVLTRFRREAEIASRLGHPNIVTVHDFNITPDGTPYLVLEYLRGESLAQRLRAGPLPIDQILSIVRQVGSALAAAHRGGIVHRDLKPQNIFLVPTEVDGALVEIAKVLDFGISKIRGSETVKTQESTLLGTPQYMAPEQAKGEHANCDERTDVFAFGTIVYEMLCGHPAFQGASIPEVVFKVVYEQPMPISEAAPGVSAAVASAVTQSMAKLADQRFRNVSAFVEAMTGQAVSQFRVPAVLPVEPGQDSGSRARSTGPRSTGNDAFAQTMGSGDHGASSVAGVDETASANAPAPATSLPPVAKSGTQIGQPTLPASGSQPVIGGPGVLTVESLGVPPVRRRSRGVLVAVGLASVVLAAAVIYFVTRGGPAKQPQVAAGDAALRVVTAPDAAALAPDATVVAVVVDAGVPRATPDAAVAVKKPVVKPPPVHDPEPGPDEPGGDDKIGQDLKQAEASLASGKLEAAERFANAVINASGNVRQHARAHAIRGVVMCTLHNDEERAQIDLRNIAPRFPGIRHTLIAACHAHGLLGSVSR